MASLGQRALKDLGIAHSVHEYDYRQKGAEAAADALAAPLSAMLKTLVVELSDGRHVFLLVPGDKDVSMRSVARALGVKSAQLAAERDAQRLTGYRVGGIGPFGSRTPLPVLVELSAVEHERVFVNGGRRGLVLGLEVDDLISAATAELVDAAV